MNYRITLPDTPGVIKVVTDNDGFPEIIYIKGREMMLTRLLSEAIIRQWDNEWLAYLSGLGYAVERVQPDLTAQQRIALWCDLYKEHKGVAYKVTGADAGKMKTLKVDAELLRFYLNDDELPQNATTWLWRGKQSIANLARYYNEVRASMATPAPSKHPNHWSPEYFRKLDGPGISEYVLHLKGLGLVPKRGRDGSIMDFIPADQSHEQ